MAWNKPGDDGDKDRDRDPWGGNKKNQGPPDIDKIIGELIGKLKALLQFKMKKASDWQPASQQDFGFGLGIAVLVLLAAWFLSGLMIVNPAEQAVVLRFGEYSDTLNPGLHWIARFIDTKTLVDVQKINSFSLQGNFLTKSSEQGDLPNQYIPVKEGSDSSDKSKNLVDVEMTVQYRVSDPRNYLFNVVDPDNTINEVASGALSEVVGRMKLDDVLTTGREMLSSAVLERTKQVLSSYHAGLEVTAVTLRRVTAPEQVQAAFNDVNRADQDKATYIQQAQAYASKVVPLAQGEAARITADANAYAQQSVLLAQAQIAKYQALLGVYQASPDITRERMYLEAMQSIFQHSNKILLDANTGNNMIYLPLDKIMNQTTENSTYSSLEDKSLNMNNQNQGTEEK